MNIDNTYKIPLRDLKVGKYQYDFKLDDSFFARFEKSEIERGNVDVEVDVERHNSMMIIDFHIDGEVEVICDRCLDAFYIPVEADNVLSVRFSTLVAENQEYLVEEGEEEDVIFADPTDEDIDVAHYMYESVCLSLPIKRVHADDENGNSLCNADVIKYLKQHKI